MGKYPRQIIKIGRPAMVLGVEASLTVPTAGELEDKKNPLEASGYSVLKFSLLDAGDRDNVKAVSANIPAADIPAVLTLTEACIHAAVQQEIGGAGRQDGKSLAYTQRILTGRFKGRTPAEILSKDPGEKGRLIETRDWLAPNLCKYKANGIQIDAINDALELLEEGKLEAPKAGCGSYVIYDAPCKLPSSKKVDKDGRTAVYGIKVIFDASMDSPFEISIMNERAKPKFLGNGTVQADPGTAVGRMDSSMRMTAGEWMKVINRCSEVVKNFDQAVFPRQWRIADDMVRRNIEQSKTA